MSGPHVIHRDDVEPFVIEREHLRGRRWRLGTAAGCVRIGLSRYVMGPGERAMPVHVHADEEELFLVLAGSGVSVEGDRAFAVREGDAIAYLPGGAAHTVVAGPDGIELLAFGSGSDTGMTWLPRAQAWWMGPRWLPHDGPSPFTLEDRAGPLEPAPVEAQCPATIVALENVEAERWGDGRVDTVQRDIGRALGTRLAGLNEIVVAPGARSAPHHVHSAEEELFVVLSGAGQVRLGEELVDVRAGSVVARPPGTGIAHQFIAGDDEPLVLLAYGTREPTDTVYYPDSRKVSLRGLGVRFRVGEQVDYWDGEA